MTATWARTRAFRKLRLAIAGSLAASVMAAVEAPAFACIAAEYHDYLFHDAEPQRLPEDDIVVEVEPDFSAFQRSPAGDFSAHAHELKVKRIVSGVFDDDVIRVLWARTSCSYLGASDTARFLVGKLITLDGQTVLAARSWSPSRMSDMSLLRDAIIRDAVALTLPEAY